MKKGGKTDDNLLSDQGLTCPGGYKNKNSIVSGTCEEQGCCEQFERHLKNLNRSKSGKKCKFHGCGRRPKNFEDLIKMVNIRHPHLNQLFLFSEKDFNNDLKDYEKKLRDWKISREGGRPLRMVTSFCKKHPDKKVNRKWDTFFGKSSLPPLCDKCKTSGVSREQIYIMDFLSLLLDVNVRHAYNHTDSEFCLSTKPLDGFSDHNEQGFLDKIKLNKHIFKCPVKKRCENSVYRGFAIEYSPDFWHKERKDRTESDDLKEKEYITGGYNYITLNNKWFLELKKTEKWKELLPQLNKLWVAYDITPSSLESRKSCHNVKNKDDIYITVSNPSNPGYNINTSPCGCDVDKRKKCRLYFGSLELFDKDELYAYAKRCQLIVKEYVEDCNQNTMSRKFSYEEKEFQINLIWDEYCEEKKKRQMAEKIKTLYKYKRLDKGKHIGYSLELKLGENGNYTKLDRVFTTNKNSPINNYYITVNETEKCCILYIKKCFYPEQYNEEYKKYQQKCIEKSIIERLCKESEKEIRGKKEFTIITYRTQNNEFNIKNESTYQTHHAGRRKTRCETKEECVKMAHLSLLSQVYPDKYLSEFKKEEKLLIERHNNYKAPNKEPVFCEICNKTLSDAGKYRRHCKDSATHKKNKKEKKKKDEKKN
jgi:hypothetical protein